MRGSYLKSKCQDATFEVQGGFTLKKIISRRMEDSQEARLGENIGFLKKALYSRNKGPIENNYRRGIHYEIQI